MAHEELAQIQQDFESYFNIAGECCRSYKHLDPHGFIQRFQLLQDSNRTIIDLCSTFDNSMTNNGFWAQLRMIFEYPHKQR